MQETRTCQNCKKEFIIEPEDFEFYKRIDVPPPTWCPECRMIRRMVWRNERVLYKRNCDVTGKSIFSMFSKEAPVKVYDRDFWWSDSWDPMIYGENIDWSRPFLQQLGELIRKVPWPSRSVNDLINSDYCMNAGNLKNCYLLFDSDHNEDCFYGQCVGQSKNCVDTLFTFESELCYEGVFLNNCYQIIYSNHCRDSYDIYFSKNLSGCSNCFGCVNLSNKQYYVFNEPKTKEEYFEIIKKFDTGSYKVFKLFIDKLNELRLKFPVKYLYGHLNYNISGNYINNSKNTLNSYMVNGCDNCKNVVLLITPSTRDSYDYNNWGWNSELVYESSAVGIDVSNIKFCNLSWGNCRELEYCLACNFSHNLFGCVGLRNKQYCILNKQYTKDEYFKMVEKIKQHMNDMPYIDSQGRVYKYGEFFPPELSPFAYNETIAQEYFPKTKEEALAQGYRWKDREERNIKPDLYTKDLPDHIKDVDNSIIGKIIQCAHSKINPDGTLEEGCNQMCTTAFKIIEPELEFYKRMNLPLPRLCPNCRHFERLKLTNPLKLWKRKCQCQGNIGKNPNNPNTYQNQTTHFHKDQPCPNEFQTSYSPDRPEIVYCEECYNSEVV